MRTYRPARPRIEGGPGRFPRPVWIRALILLSVGLAFSTACSSGSSGEDSGPVTRTVALSGDADFRSIQACISESGPGDTCLVYPGTYRERIRFLGRAVTVRATEGPEETILDGRQLGPVVRFWDGEDEDTVLDGFTITNGSAQAGDDGVEHGGGIQILVASPVIQNCILQGNRADGDGGGIYCFGTGSRPEILDVVFQENTADGQGGGLLAVYSAPELTSCVFSGNQAPLGGALSIRYRSQVVLTNCTIENNSASDRAGAVYLLNANLEIRDTAVRDNPSPDQHPVVMDFDPEQGTSTTLSLSNVDLDGSIGRTASCSAHPTDCVLLE